MDRRFQEKGLQIVNLALAGFMDSRTIQAFLNFYGYTAVDNPLVREADVANAIIAVRMDSRRFERASRGGPPFPSSSTISAHRPGSGSQGAFTKFTAHLIKKFPDNTPGGMTREQAGRFLTIAEGDLEEAIEMQNSV